jgi:hypothetical protein
MRLNYPLRKINPFAVPSNIPKTLLKQAQKCIIPKLPLHRLVFGVPIAASGGVTP